MSTLKERLHTDFVTHYKNKDQMQVMTLRQVNAAIATEEKAGKSAKEFSDDDVLRLLGQEVKKRTATADLFEKAGKTERAQAERDEAEFLATYLPKQLTREEVEAVVAQVLTETGTDANIGLVMKSVMAQVKGKADGKMVKEIVTAQMQR